MAEREWSNVEKQTRSQLEELFVGPPGDLTDDVAAYNALHRLYQLRDFVAKHRAGEFFPRAEGLLDGLDPEPSLSAWETGLIQTHGEAGRSFVAEIASKYGVEIPGATIRAPHRQSTFEKERPRAGRGFDRCGETDPTLLDLQDRILASPDDDALYLVYADRLQELGRLHGELISVAMRGSAEQCDAFIAEHGVELLGPLAEAMSSATLTWKRGFIVGARLADRDGYLDAMQALLERPIAELLEHLALGVNDSDVDWEREIELLADTGPHEALRSLHVGDFEFPDEHELSWATVGELGRVWSACPNLEELTVQGSEIELGTISAPALRRLTIRTTGLQAEVVHAIANAQWPALVELELWLGYVDYGEGIDHETLEPILRAERMPKLKVLKIKNAELVDELVDALGRSSVLKQLEVVDLSMGTMSDQGGASVLSHLDAWSHLRSLNLHANAIGDRVAAQLARNAFIEIGTQKPEDHRYISVSE